MATPAQPAKFAVGDPLPRIVLRDATGDVFDSWDQANAGRTRIYWLGGLPAQPVLAELAKVLASCEADLRIVASAAPPDGARQASPWLIDPGNELGRAVGATGPLAVVVDAGGRLAALLATPAPHEIMLVATQLHAA